MINNNIEKMYVKNDTLTTRIGLHDKYSVNKYGFGNWIFDQYILNGNIKVLELGCGTADIWKKKLDKLPRNIEIILSDFSPLMVEKAKNLLSGKPMFSFQQIDIQNIPYDNDTFDIVIANHMLYHVPDKDRALSEVKRVLKPKGLFYASTLGKMSLKELNDIYLRVKDKGNFSFSKDISFTLENGFELLSKHFTDVDKKEYIDSLEVTDINDLIEYIKSYNEVPEFLNDELFSLLNAGFVNGVFKIRKEQGIFICKKE